VTLASTRAAAVPTPTFDCTRGFRHFGSKQSGRKSCFGDDTDATASAGAAAAGGAAFAAADAFVPMGYTACFPVRASCMIAPAGSAAAIAL
jgi:hypothetical protein